MRTNAIAGRRSAEQVAAAGALVENASALDAMFTDLFGAPSAAGFDHAWAAGNAAVTAYASAPTEASKQSALGQMNDAFVTQLSAWLADTTDPGTDASSLVLESELQAVVTVIDDQRARSWSRLAADDRSAAASTEVVADVIAAAAIAKLHARFG